MGRPPTRLSGERGVDSGAEGAGIPLDERSKKARNASAPGRTPGKPRAAKDSAAISDTPGARVGVVCVGASAGGLEAFTTLLQEMPPDTGLGIRVHPTPEPGPSEHARRDPGPGDGHAGVRGQRRAAGRAEPGLRHPARPHDGHSRGSPQPQRPRDTAAPPDRSVHDGARGRPGPPRHRRGALGHRHRRHRRTGSDQGGRRHHLRAGRRAPSTTACRTAPSPRGSWTSCCLRNGSRARSPASRAIRTWPMQPRPAAGPLGLEDQILALVHQQSGIDFTHYKFNTL